MRSIVAIALALGLAGCGRPAAEVAARARAEKVVAQERATAAAAATARAAADAKADAADRIAQGERGSLCTPAEATSSVASDLAARLPRQELSELVFEAMPREGAGHFEWTHMQDAPVLWITNGIADCVDGSSHRDALARIQVNGAYSTALHGRVEELAWTISLVGHGGAKWGADQITIMPGTEHDVCFGTGYELCSFNPDLALKSSSYRLHTVCRAGPGWPLIIYKLTAPGREPTYATYREVGGSGGSSGNLTLSLEEPEPHSCDRT